jgi:hypothetical protein
VEQVERVDVVVNGGRRAYGRSSSIILVVSALFGIVAAVITAFPPAYILSSPFFQGAYPIMGALGITSVGFYIFALAVILVPYRRDERWAWYTLWMLPLLWLSQFVLAPDLPYYLMLAALTTLGLILPYRRFFSGAKERAIK